MSDSSAPPTTSSSESMQHLRSLMQRKSELEAQIEAMQYGGSSGAARPGVALTDSEGFPRADLDVHSVRIARQSLAQLQTDHVRVMKEIETAMFALHAEAKKNKASMQQEQQQQQQDSQTAAGAQRNDRIFAVPAAHRTQQQEQSAPQIIDGCPSSRRQQQSLVTPPAPQLCLQTHASARCLCCAAAASSSSSPPSAPSLAAADAFFLVDSVSADGPASVAGLRVGDRILQFGSVSRRNNSKESMRAVVTNSVGRGLRVLVWREGEGAVELRLRPQQWAGHGLLGCHLTDL